MDNVKFKFGDIVYLCVNPERCGMVTQIKYAPSGVTYVVSWDDFQDRQHFDIELTKEKTFDAKPA